ncbi:hypothetical protein [Candidatus Protochlamydia phocaeensis]|uniref:hypothetical protein n=1 Tax=Candidatus Protochlamydia phocaeensis TaxID=1414722 RepID=UPI000838DC26|nr:hypothetical protein [Candidatus Protochlamydia phocaeensis]
MNIRFDSFISNTVEPLKKTVQTYSKEIFAAAVLAISALAALLFSVYRSNIQAQTRSCSNIQANANPPPDCQEIQEIEVKSREILKGLPQPSTPALTHLTKDRVRVQAKRPPTRKPSKRVH